MHQILIHATAATTVLVALFVLIAYFKAVSSIESMEAESLTTTTPQEIDVMIEKVNSFYSGNAFSLFFIKRLEKLLHFLSTRKFNLDELY
jgi:hypothetical protein